MAVAQTRESDPVDEIVQSYLQGMGFVRADIEVAMQAMQSNETDVVMEYLLNNPRGDDFLAGSEGDNGPAQGDETISLGGEPDGAPAVPDTLSALVGDISAVEDQDVSLALTVDSLPQEALQTDSTGESAGAGAGIQGQIQTQTQGEGESTADVSVLRRDLGQLINELSRLCVEEGTPAEGGAETLPPPPSDQSQMQGLPPTGPGSSEATGGSPTPGPSDPFSTARVSVADARLLLQALGRRGLQEVPDAPSLLTPPPLEDGEDSVVSFVSIVLHTSSDHAIMLPCILSKGCDIIIYSIPSSLTFSFSLFPTFNPFLPLLCSALSPSSSHPLPHLLPRCFKRLVCGRNTDRTLSEIKSLTRCLRMRGEVRGPDSGI